MKNVLIYPLAFFHYPVFVFEFFCLEWYQSYKIIRAHFNLLNPGFYKCVIFVEKEVKAWWCFVSLVKLSYFELVISIIKSSVFCKWAEHFEEEAHWDNWFIELSKLAIGFWLHCRYLLFLVHHDVKSCSWIQSHERVLELNSKPLLVFVVVHQLCKVESEVIWCYEKLEWIWKLNARPNAFKSLFLWFW